jgi:ribosomal protein S27AE
MDDPKAKKEVCSNCGSPKVILEVEKDRWICFGCCCRKGPLRFLEDELDRQENVNRAYKRFPKLSRNVQNGFTK